jgi:rhodanese-related sulfurtransferase
MILDVLGLGFTFLAVAGSSLARQNSTIVSLRSTEIKPITDSNPGVILDVRTQGEYQSGHVAGAVLLNFLSSSFRERVDSLDRTKSYYLYCRSGNRSLKAALVMREMGFTRIYNVTDGFSGMKAAGYPVSP